MRWDACAAPRLRACGRTLGENGGGSFTSLFWALQTNAPGARAAQGLSLRPPMRIFGLDEANRLVPFLARTFDLVRPWVKRVQEISGELEPVEELEEGRSTPSERVELDALREEQRSLMERIRAELEKVEELGIEVKAADGLVDFRAMHGERQVFLCWRHGEEQVLFWHELDAGFVGRQPISRPADFAPTFLS